LWFLPFSQCGEIAEVRLAHERDGKLKKFAYIEFKELVRRSKRMLIWMLASLCSMALVLVAAVSAGWSEGGAAAG
jgi:hypothetical protein